MHSERSVGVERLPRWRSLSHRLRFSRCALRLEQICGHSLRLRIRRLADLSWSTHLHARTMRGRCRFPPSPVRKLAMPIRPFRRKYRLARLPQGAEASRAPRTDRAGVEPLLAGREADPAEARRQAGPVKAAGGPRTKEFGPATLASGRADSLLLPTSCEGGDLNPYGVTR